MNIIVVSLERAPDRREKMKAQLSALNIEVVIMDAVDSENLSEEETDRSLSLPGGWRFGEKFRPGEIACTMSHIKTLKIAQEKGWSHYIVLEDDIVIAEDFEKRINFLFKIIPPNWEHIYLSGIPRFGFNTPPNLQFVNVVPSVFTECTHSMMIRNTVYEKIINRLSLFETTTDDIYNSMIRNKELISYTYYPFVTYPKDDFTYIWGHKLERVHQAKQYFRNSI